MKHVTILIVVLLTQSIFAQKITKDDLKEIETINHKQIITQALNYNDVQTAISSMHYIISIEGETSSYKDSLAIVYFKMGNYISSHLLAKELLATKPNNQQLLEINAVSLQNLGATKDAIAAYEALFAQTKNMAYGYQLANLQYGIKRLAEAQDTVIQTLECEAIENAYLQFPVDKNQNQNVPIKAAVYNLQGLIAFELKDTNAANIAFQKAIEIMPKFAAATQNVNAILVTMQNERKKQLTTNKSN